MNSPDAFAKAMPYGYAARSVSLEQFGHATCARDAHRMLALRPTAPILSGEGKQTGC